MLNFSRSVGLYNSSGSEECDQPATPHCNAAVLRDMLMSSHQTLLQGTLADAEGLRDGITLLKVWARQRNLHQVTSHHLLMSRMCYEIACYLVPIFN